jgi:hypothetical protein
MEPQNQRPDQDPREAMQELYARSAREDNEFSSYYQSMEGLLPLLSEFELGGLVGAIIAEYVNRGNDHDTALDNVVKAAEGGVEGSQIFDRMQD